MVGVILLKGDVLPWLPGEARRSLTEPMLRRHFLTYMITRNYRSRLEPDGINTLPKFILDVPKLALEQGVEGNLRDGQTIMTKVLDEIKQMNLKDALKELEIDEGIMNRLKKTYSLHQGEKIYGYGGKVIIEDTREVPEDEKQLEKEPQTIIEDINIGAKGDELKLWLGAVFSPREDKTKVMNDEYRITKEDFLENITGFSLISFENDVATFIMNYSETEEKNREILEEMDFIDLQLDEDFTPFDERRSETFKIGITDSLTKAIEDSNEEALTKEIKAFLLDKRVPIVYDLFENLTRISSSILNPSILVTDTNIEFRMPTILELSEDEYKKDDDGKLKLIGKKKVKRPHLVISADIHLTISGRFIIPRVTIPSLSGPASKLKQSGPTQRARGELIQHIRSSIKELEHAIGELI